MFEQYLDTIEVHGQGSFASGDNDFPEFCEESLGCQELTLSLYFYGVNTGLNLGEELNAVDIPILFLDLNRYGAISYC